MGVCASKPPKPNPYAPRNLASASPSPVKEKEDDVVSDSKNGFLSSPFFPFYTPSPAAFLSKKSPMAKGGNSTPLRFLRRPFPPPSPAKHIRAMLRRRQSKKAAAIPEEGEEEEEEMVVELDKRFGFSKELRSRLEMGDEVGRGHFGYTCAATYKKGELKDQAVAVKVIPKAKVSLSDNNSNTNQSRLLYAIIENSELSDTLNSD